ncbi:MAG: hypothetical protein HQK65_01075 [Desulfamplus sp.]|nr:hypothetical protein [Desulfamplus sp.]
MSGVKTGNVKISTNAALESQLMVPLMKAGVFVSDGGYGFYMAGKGLYKLGKSQYTKLEKHCEQAIKEKNQESYNKSQKRLTRINEKIAKINSNRDICDTGVDESDGLMEDTEHESINDTEINNYSKLIENMEKVTQNRKQYEELLMLDNTVSREFEEKINEVYAKKQKAEEKRKQHLQNLKHNKNGIDIQLINAKLNIIEPVYPEIAKESRKKLFEQELNQFGIKKTVKEIDKKIKALENHKDNLCRLNDIYSCVLKSFYIPFMDQSDIESFKQKYYEIRGNIENNDFDNGDIKEKLKMLKEDTVRLFSRARENEIKQRFQEHIEIMKDAMSKNGYLFTVIEEKKRVEEKKRFLYIDFIKTEKDGEKKVSFCLKEPDFENNTLDDFRMFVDPSGYNSEEERNTEGKNIITSLLSAGFEVNCRETSELIAEKYKERFGQKVDIKIISKTAIKTTCGKIIHFDANTEIDTLVQNIEKTITEKQKMPEFKERLKERE